MFFWSHEKRHIEALSRICISASVSIMSCQYFIADIKVFVYVCLHNLFKSYLLVEGRREQNLEYNPDITHLPRQRVNAAIGIVIYRKRVNFTEIKDLRQQTYL